MFKVATAFQSAPSFPRRHWILLLSVLVSLLGCAGKNVGYRISEETVAFIQPGVTTRSDVLDNLGPPLLEIQDPHVAAYSWGRAKGLARPVLQQDQSTMPAGLGYAVPPPPPPMEESEATENRRWVYCIALDANNRVTRAGRLELQGAGSLESAVRKWAARTGENAR